MSGTVASATDHQGAGRATGTFSANLVSLAAGAILLAFIGGAWNAVIAAWLAPVFLIRFFRGQERWHTTLIAVPLMLAAFYLPSAGSWDLPVAVFLQIAAFRSSVFLAALYADRIFAPRLGMTLATLVYPATFVVGDLLYSLLNPVAGVIHSPASSQFSLPPLIQVASVTGIWGITFLTGWFGPTVNCLWERGFDVRRAARPVAVFASVIVVLVFAGTLRLNVFGSTAPVVRIGSVAVAHPRNYWDETRQGNPPEGAARLADELRAIQDELFLASERAVAAGARIVFWSEGNAVLYDEDAFLERAREFSRAHGVYFAPAMLVQQTGQDYGENKVLLIDPEGQTLFSYEKTKSVFPTYSDGIIPVADTPYGKIAAAICFDMDFPTFVNQLGSQDVDLMLVPAYDNASIKNYHTEVALFRAVENGFSLVRQVNEGESMAVDSHGNVLAFQDFFATDDATMIADVPTRGVNTIYGLFGDWFAYACLLFMLGLIAWQVVGRQSRATARASA